MDKIMIVHEWLRNCNDKELIALYGCTESEQIREKLPFMAFRWVISKCKELSDLKSLMYENLKVPGKFSSDEEFLAKSKEVTDAQLGHISQYKESGACIKCGKSTLDFVTEMNKRIRKGGRAYPIEIVFWNIYEGTNLCINCIGEFLLEYVRELAAQIDDDTVNKYRQKVTPKTNLWDAIFH